MDQPRKKLSDILLPNSDRERLASLWKGTAAAAEFAPLPPGEYTFRILTGELFTSKRGTPGYKLVLEVTEGEHEGRRAWHDLWLTAAALPMTKRDLSKLGVTNLEQLEQPLPAGILIRGKLALRHGDDGNENNQLRRFRCVGIEPGDAFEPPADEGDQAGADQANAVESEADFPFGANATTSAGESEGAAPEPSPNDKPPADANGTAPPAPNGEPPAGTNGALPKPKGKRKPADTSAATGGGDNP